YNDDAGRIEKVSARATQWLDDHLAGERRETPFLLMVHTYDVHAPYEDTPARFRQLFLDEVEPRPPNFFRQRPTSKILRAYAGKAELTPEELEYSIALYDGGIRHVDEWFRGFRRYLERRGLWRQSVVVVLSDHGEEFKEHGKLFHEQLFSPVTRIPWILKLPEGVADGLAGHVESTTVESLDMMPTLLDLAEVPTPAGVEGESLMPLLEGENRRSVAVSECKGSCEQLALAEGEWRLIQDRRSGRQHLFRYREDPLEADDQSGPHGERAAAMAKTLEGWEKRVARRASQPVDYTDETLEQLSALGYVDTVRALRSPEEPKPREEIFADDFETGGLAAWEGEESPAAGAEAEKPRGRRAP
ncbi:MAG: sulfatase-like hydrolase/transferase, partial [Acidobacteriota bacterium]